MNNNNKLKFEDFYQIPFAILSFVFFHIIKFIMRGFMALINKKKKTQEPSWVVISEALVSKPMVLPVFMTKAPRWNPHAIIGATGPIAVISKLEVDTKQANSSADNWGVIVQSLDSKYEKRMSASDANTDLSWESMPLNSGFYTASIRYYGCKGTLYFPTIKFGEEKEIPPLQVESNNNEFYEKLNERRNWFYVGLNYYVYSMLRFSEYLPKKFIVKQFLPSGDPGTAFKYGALLKGTQLKIELWSEVLVNYDVYLTIYNKASFPTQWDHIKKETTTTQINEVAGFYLIRFLVKQSGVKLDLTGHSIISIL